jgi:hypothetical protein
LERLKSLQLGPWPGYTGVPIGGDQIPVRGLTSGEGKVRGKAQELTAVTGWPLLGKRGIVAAIRWRTGASGDAPRGGDGVLVAGGLESGREVARKLPRDDVVLMVHLAGAERRWIVGTTARPSGGGSSSSPAQWSGQSSTGD